MPTAFLVLAGLVTVVVVTRGFQRGSLRIDAPGAYLFVVALLHQAPITAAKFTNSYEYGLNSDGDLYVASLGWAEQLYRVADLGVLISTILLLFRSFYSGRIRASGPAIAAISVVASGMIAEVLTTGHAPSGQPFLLLLALFASGVTMGSWRGIATGGALAAVAVLVAGTLLAAIRPDAAFTACLDKCTVLGEVFTGGTSHGNGLALILTLSLTFVWLAFDGKSRIWMVSYIVIVIVMSGSRTSLLAVALVVLVLVVTQPKLLGTGISGRRLPFATLAAGAASLAALVVPLVVSDELFATGRGYLWHLALSRLAESPFLGLGSHAWQDLFNQGYFGSAAAYSTHNQWIEALFLGGIAGGIAQALFIVTVLFAGPRKVKFATVPLLLAIMTLGILERPVAYNLVDALSWAMFGLLMFANAAAPSDRDSNPASHKLGEFPEFPAFSAGSLAFGRR